MAHLILGILLLTLFAPLVIPWGKSLLIYSITAWFVLWIAFFLQMQKQSSQTSDLGIINEGTVLAFSIIAFIIVIAVRCIAQLIWYKLKTIRNHT